MAVSIITKDAKKELIEKMRDEYVSEYKNNEYKSLEEIYNDAITKCITIVECM